MTTFPVAFVAVQPSGSLLMTWLNCASVQVSRSSDKRVMVWSCFSGAAGRTVRSLLRPLLDCWRLRFSLPELSMCSRGGIVPISMLLVVLFFYSCFLVNNFVLCRESPVLSCG